MTDKPNKPHRHHFPEIKTTYMQFTHPYSMIISGPSGSGKSVFIVRMLKHLPLMLDQKMDEILWYHGMDQPLHKDIKKMFPTIQFLEGLPDCSQFDPAKRKLVICDDMMSQTKGNAIADLFTKGRHTNTSIIYVCQNLFAKNREQRDISLNTNYIVLTKNVRDKQQVGILASQMGNHNLIQEAYAHATCTPFGFLFLDFTQTAADELRVRTHIFC